MIEFDRELESFVQQEVASGHFSSRQDLLSHAVRLLQRDRDEAVSGILLGLDDAAAGRSLPLAEAIAEIRTAGHAKSSTGT
jgi:Arc/MetJ-type ribon-helix-helix transcriptional regulator